MTTMTSKQQADLAFDETRLCDATQIGTGRDTHINTVLQTLGFIGKNTMQDLEDWVADWDEAPYDKCKLAVFLLPQDVERFINKVRLL
jgi:hypothetical protein